jgi:chaperonin GroES
MEGVAKPLGDRVLVKYTKGDEKTASGIIITDSAMRGQCVWGEVISVGEGIFTQTGDKIPMTVEVGDKVMYKKDMGGDVIKLNDEEYLMFREHDLIMVIKNK